MFVSFSRIVKMVVAGGGALGDKPYNRGCRWPLLTPCRSTNAPDADSACQDITSSLMSCVTRCRNKDNRLLCKDLPQVKHTI